nr:hypothetical protein [Tanacetum cinerariifolium]
MGYIVSDDDDVDGFKVQLEISNGKVDTLVNTKCKKVTNKSHEMCTPRPRNSPQSQGKTKCIQGIGAKSIVVGFEFKTKSSNKIRFDAICIHKECTWRILARMLDESNWWLLTTVEDVRTCSITRLYLDHRNAMAIVLGALLVDKVANYRRVYRPKEIQMDLKIDLNIDISYKKAWRGRKKAFDMAIAADELTEWAAAKVHRQKLKSAKWIVDEVDKRKVYQVNDLRNIEIVDLDSYECTCQKKTTVRETYKELVYPLQGPSSWETPTDKQNVLPPTMEKWMSG